MNLQDEWQEIKRHFNLSFASSLHVSIASVDADGNPTSTPIGSMFLNDDQTGFYFEKFPSKLPRHAKENPQVCVLAVNSSKWFWIKSLWKNKFSKPPAIKLYGELGKSRKVTNAELARLKRRMRRTKYLKGHVYLWEDMHMLREIRFFKAEKINLGEMTD